MSAISSEPTMMGAGGGAAAGKAPASTYLSIAVATLAAFVFSSLYYMMLANVWRAVDPAAVAGMSPSVPRVAAEILRTLAVTYVLSRLLCMLRVGAWKSVWALAGWLWFGFSFVMWTGAIMWEHTPWQVAAIHSGDWLFKTFIVVSILNAWPGQNRSPPKSGRGSG